MIRGAVGLLLVTGLCIMAVILPPVVGAFIEIMHLAGQDVESPEAYGFRGGSVLGTTLAWSAIAGLVATLLGWGPGRILASRPGSMLAWITVIPLVLPAALVFDAWWLEASPQSWIGSMAAENDAIPLLRSTVLALALVGWGWPIAAWAIAARGVRGGDRLLARMDGVKVWPRMVTAFRSDRSSLLAAWMLVTVFLAGNTVCFDLAQVHSWGFELRTLDARGADAATVFRAGLPALTLAVAGAVIAVLLLRPAKSERGGGSGQAGGRWVWLIPLLCTGLPMLMLLRRGITAFDPEVMGIVHGPAMINTLLLGLGCGLISSVVAAGVMLGRLSGRWPATISVIITGVLAVLALVPSTLLAVGFETIFNRPGLDVVYRSFMVLLLGVSARTGIVAAIIGLLAAAGASRRLVLMDAPRTGRQLLSATSPAIRGAGIAAAALGAALAVGEIAMVARVQPPGVPLVGTALLNAMHYQYVDSVIPAILGLVLIAGAAAGVLRWTLLRRVAPLAVMFAATMMVVGCSPPTEVENPEPVAAEVVFGGTGMIPGRFDYPRAIAIDADRSQLYVIDKSARVQRFSLDGEYLGGWMMPQWENGKPTGVAVAPDGRVFIADTHYHRIAVFNEGGEELFAFGRYGEENGEFIYPTDIAFGPDGILFVAEYGGNDRIQVFDSEGNWLRAFGSMGATREQFSRPQGIAWHEDRQELFIADAINHRVVVTDALGEVQRILGSPGRQPGEMSYPYDITLPGDGTVMVVEFGNNRVQRLDLLDGDCQGIWGGTGEETGRLRYPWGIDAKAGVLAVLDSGNSRVLVGDAP